MQWKTFWSVIGCSVTSGFGVLPACFDLPLPVTIASAAGAAVCAVYGASKAIHGSEMFLELKLDAKDQMVRWVAVAAGGHVAWVTGFQLHPNLWWAWIAGLAGLGVAQYWGARWHEYEQRRRAVVAPVVAQQVAAQEEHENSSKIQRQIKATLRLSDLDHLELIRWEWIDDRGVVFWVRKPPAAEMPKKKAAKELATPDTEDIVANSMSRVVGEDLESRWVSIRRENTASVYKIAVMNQDVMAQVIPYHEDLTEPLRLTSITEPAIQGFTLDGEPRSLLLSGHGQNIGQSGSGKSAMTQANLAHITRCSDAVSWICGTEKLYDLVSHWVEPFEGTRYSIPIDWIAYGPADTAEMLAAAMRIVRQRQRTRKGQRKDWKRIVITLDEASFALHPKLAGKARAKFEGSSYTATDLVAMILKAGRSAGVFMHLATQRGTQDNFGDQGGDITTAFTWSNTFQTNDPGEVGRNTGDYQIPRPDHVGEAVHKPPEGQPERIKVPYAQEDDRSKAALHNGLTLTQIAWSRRGLDRELDMADQQAAGSAYLRRHQYADADLFEYLTGERPEAVSGGQSLESESKQAADAELRNLLGGVFGQAPELPSPAAPVDAEAPAAEPVEVKRTARARVAAIVAEFDGRLSKPDIVERLKRDGGKPVSAGVLANALTEMVKAGELIRPDDGMYVAPGVEPDGSDELVTVGDQESSLHTFTS